MKKFLSYLGALSLIMISFIISEQTVIVVKETDEIMTKIKEENQKYDQPSIDAKIENNTITPGLNGKKINIKKSYDQMKKIGIFNPKYYIYDDIIPEISIKNRYDKYIISGNKNKNMISLIFIIHENDNINNIISIVEKQNIKVTFFIDNEWLEKNNQLTLALIGNGHTIGILNNNQDKGNKEFIWMNKILKEIGKQKNNYCYTEEENEKLIEECKKARNYTIKPNIIIKQRPLQEIKQQIRNGSLIAMKINSKTNNELELVINYIKSKGYSIVNITENISEKNNN